MVSMTETALWAALFLLTAHTAYGQNNTTYDYDTNEFNNGSCSYKKLNCATGSLCVQNPGHTRFKCFCPDGYAGDGYLEEFKTGATGCELVGGPVLCTSSNDCNEYADCNPIDNLRSQCVCRDGFTGSGAIDNGCTDIAECQGNPCAENANCYEEPGGFTCKCDSARNYEGDGYVKCTWICYSHQDCAPHGRCNGNRTCECDTGFTGDGRSCTDIDECTNGDSDCPDKSTCNNTPGSFQCVCANGYEYKDKTCVPLYQTCDAIYRANNNILANGRYTIDLDSEGPLPAIEVDCIVKDGVAITEIAPTKSFPQTVPKTGGDKPVQYPIDPTPLINNSDFCSQRVWLQCTNKLTGGMIGWEDRQGRKRKGWGSTKDGVCGCGQFRKCPNGCNCGFGAEGEDEGLIVDKDQLPVSKVTFPALNTANAGNYIVGPLRCGPKLFDIPRDCHEAKVKNNVEKNQPLVIDIDGNGPNRPFLVYCNQEAYSHVGIIEIPPDQLVISRTPAEGSSVEYLIPGPDVNNAINGSVFCSQRVEYECSSDTMTAAGVKVETRSGVLTYFPGGSNDQPGSCGCGLTNSCEDKRFKCNCNIGDGKARKDQGLIINRSRLPVLKVKSTSSDNFYKIGPLQCSRFQFGIEPNCEKLRQSDVTETYSYRIDPDGPGNLEPFTAQCEMDANKGVTVINNENGGGLNMASGKSFSINYPNASPAQLTALKDRSTSCVQSVTFTGCSGASVSIDGITYNSGKPLSDVLEGPCNGKSCKCDSPIKAIAKDKLPIYEIKGGSASVTIGPLMCSEIFPDCQSYASFIGKKGVLGENKIAKDVLTIDPDGPGDGEPFVVKCNFKETLIQKPTTIDPSQMKVRPGKTNPGVVCWNMSYTDQAGSGIGAPQMAALMDNGKNCAQTLKLSCENAVGTGMVSYRTCGGTKITGFVSGDVEATCACGASGTCMGGPDKGCNCDSSGDVRTLDENLIITNNMLPICEVCIELEDTAGAGAGQPESRFIRFDVGDLRCGRKQGRRGNCQMYRQEDDFAELEEEVFQDMWFDTTGKPILVGCRFKPDPGIGELVVRPADPVFEPGTGYSDGNITVVYKGFTISAIREAMAGSNYCTQDILFFCAAQIPQLTGNYGLFSDGNRLEASDYSMRALKPTELTKLCSDPRYAAQCTKCPNPKRLVITNMNKLPLTSILLPKDSKATVVIDDTACSYTETDCDAILKKDLVENNLQKDGYYLIDPDQAGPVTPFRVKCDFIENQGITQVPSDPTLVEGQVGEGGNDAATDFNFQNTYPTASPEQINSLAQNSAFCWQGVKYECTETPLTSQAQLTAFNNQVLTSFGTGDNSAALGCACGVLGTCKTEDVSCNCDSKGSMVDRGFLTDKNVLPVTGFKGKVKANGRGKIKVTDVRCGPSPVDIPRDCAEAYEWGEKNGINYRVQGEFLVNPDPATVRPFLAFCDYSDPENPKTRIRPRPTKQKPVGDTDPEVEYQGPSDDQLKALAKISVYCYQPVKINCYGAKFLKGGVKFQGADGVDRSFWSSGDGDQPTCTCGTENLCGGTVSRRIQEATDCNCDIGDDVWRSDAAILRVKGRGPLRKLLTSGVFSASQGRLNLTVGDLVCSKKPLSFNECDNGFNDCAPQAKCVDQTSGYRCECPDGWQGKISKSVSNPDPPMSNGRQCVDDDECSRPNRCRYNSDCVNTLGSYQCTCKQGFRNTDDFNCVDIDECTENSHKCDANARCVNTNGAYRCRCKKGFRGTGRQGKCHPVGQCACFGDPHCLSFDGRWNHYQGICTYTMAENNCGGATVAGIPKFKVKTNNWDRSYKGDGLYSWIKEATVEVYGKTILIGQGRKIWVDGQEQTAYRMLSEDKTTVLLKISVIGFKVQLWTNFGLEVLADGVDEVTVITPANMQNTTCGLCGNYNGNPADDWIVGPKCPPKEGQVTTRETLFGNSWSVESDESCAVDCDPPPRNKTCNVPESQAKQVCDRLFNADSPFSKAGCIAQMPSNDLTAFRFSCEYDLCHTADLRAAQCDVAEALASYCADLLADGFEWRSDDMCAETAKCKDNEEYLVCGPESEPTCLSPGPVVIENCMESCFCKEGFVRQGEECIKAAQCGCEYANSFLKIGDEILVDDCSKKVTCAEHDTLKELDNQCAETEACKTDDTGAMSCELSTTTQAPTTTTPAPTTPAPTTPAPTTPAPTTPAPTTPAPTTPAPTTPAPTTPAPTTPAPTTPAPTTPAPTTPAPTTPAPTTPAPTTPAPTTPAPTTPAPTTPAPTTPAPTTPAPTTPAPTTPAPTTPAPTTPAPTTPAPTTPAPTTPAPTTPAPTTPVAPGPGPTDVPAPPVAPTTPGEPGPTEPGPTQPGPTQPGPTQPGPTQPGPTEPGPTPPGPAESEPTEPGPTEPGPTEPGPTEPGPTEPGPTPPGPTEPGPTEPGPTPPGPNEPGPTEPGPTPPGPTEPGPTEPGPTQPGPTQPGPTQPGPTEPGPTQPGPTQPGPTEPGPTEPGTTEPGPTEPGPTEPGPTEQGPTQPGPTQPGPTQPGPTEPGPTEPGPTQPGPTEPGPTEPGPTEPEPTEPGPTEPGPTPPGPTEPGPTEPGPTPPGPTQPGPTEPGPTPPGPTEQGPTPPGPTEPGPTQPGPTEPGPTQPGPTEPGPTEPGPTPPGPTEPGPTEPGPTEPGPTQPGPTEPGPTEPGPTQPGPTQPGPTQPGPTQPGPTEPGPTQPGPTEPGPTQPGPTQPGPTQPGPTEPGPTEPRPTQPGPTEPGPTEPGPTQPADPCTGVSCTKPNTQCQAGTCVCKMGYTADCEVCKDIDECETGDNTCIHLGQKCVNTEGSFQCQCQDGFVKKDDFCHDINECEDAETNCGEHAECKNLLGTYQCICCQGYSKNAEQCQRDVRLDAVYGAPGEECCACSGGQCRNPEPVCGSDGKTYGNFAAMVVQGCRDNRTIEVDHKGNCEDSCSDVKCDKPFQKCSQTGPGGSAKCSCPDCGGASTPDNSDPVCGSNKKVYSSACMFRLVMCEIDRSDIKLEDSMEPCGEGKDEPVTKWSDWSECDVKCGKGRTRRNRQRLRQTDLPLTQEASCYKLCNDGPCRPGTCNNPGQVCVVDGATGKGRCECPDCTGRPESPVCGLVGNVVRSFHNECKLKRTACELAKNFQLLENRACEEKPQNCSVTRNFAKLRDADGCVSAGDQDVGFCYGGCGDVPGKCCRPDTTATPQRSANLTYTCPDGSTRTKQEQVITACSCVAEPEQ